MPLVVFLRGLNVGGRRRFRPTTLAKQLQHLEAVNIGAAGTFVIRKPVAQSELRREIARRLPFEAEIVICNGREVLNVLTSNPFEGTIAPNVVRFVSVLSRRPRRTPRMPILLPAEGEWLLQVIARSGPFLLGLYRRHMKVIGYLGSLDRVFGVPLTTRNWNTMTAIGKVLEATERQSRRASHRR